MSFHHEFINLHECPKIGETTRLNAGDVIRVFDPASPFSDAVVLGFDDEGNAKLSRSYVYAHSVGTTGPVPLLGAETFTATANNLRHYVRQYGVLQTGRVV